MDIRNLNAPQIRDQAASKAKEERESARTSEAQAGADGTRVSISPDAAALKSVELGVSVEPFDRGKVEAIRQAIEQGRYHIDPERLAANFSKIESDLIQ